MNISFDEYTKVALMKELQENNKSAIRLIVKGFTWAGALLGVVLDEQQSDDEKIIIDELTFIAKKDILHLLENVRIEYAKGFFRNSFKVYSLRKHPESCSR